MTTTIRALCIVSVSALVLCAGGCQLQPRPRTGQGAEQERISQAHALAYDASRTRDPAAAIQKYEQALSQYRSFPAAWNNLGTLQMKVGSYLEAEQAFAEAAEISQSDPRPLYNRGLLWMKRHYPADARVYFRQALERDPNYLPALRGAVRADMLLRNGTEETLENIRRAVLIEKNERWLRYFEFTRTRVQADLNMPERPGSEHAPSSRGRAPTEQEKALFNSQANAAAH